MLASDQPQCNLICADRATSSFEFTSFAPLSPFMLQYKFRALKAGRLQSADMHFLCGPHDELLKQKWNVECVFEQNYVDPVFLL